MEVISQDSDVTQGHLISNSILIMSRALFITLTDLKWLLIWVIAGLEITDFKELVVEEWVASLRDCLFDITRWDGFR